MIDLLNIVSSVFGYILFGFFVNKLQILPKKYIDYFDFTGFNILLPLALIIYFWQVSFPQIDSIGLIISFFASGIFIFITGFLISKQFLNFKTDDSALFGLASCFGNTVAMGIPLMYAVLGPINTIPYMILVFFHGIIHFSYTVIIIEVYRNRKKSIVEIFYQILLGIIKNIVLFGMIIGFILNYSNLIVPSIMKEPLDIFVKLALPMVLISLGLALGNFKIRENIYGALLLTILKNFIHPIIAFCLAHFILELDSLLVIIVTMAAALPSGSQSYYFAYRYNSLQAVVSSNVVLSTFVSFFTLSLLLVFFDIT
jgi:predicted permease